MYVSDRIKLLCLKDEDSVNEYLVELCTQAKALRGFSAHAQTSLGAWFPLL